MSVGISVVVNVCLVKLKNKKLVAITVVFVVVVDVVVFVGMIGVIVFLFGRYFGCVCIIIIIVFSV